MTKNTQSLNHLESCLKTDVGDFVQAIETSPNGEFIGIAAISGSVYILDSQSWALRNLGRHKIGCTSLTWNPTGTILFSGGQDGLIRRFHLPSDCELPALNCGSDWVEKITCNHLGALAVAAGKRLITYLQPDDANPHPVEYDAHRSTIADINWKLGGGQIATAAYGGARIYKIGQSKATKEFPWKGSSLTISFSPDGRFLASGQQDQCVHIWVLATGEDLSMSGFPLKVGSAAWSHDARWLATSGSSVVTLWDCGGKGPAGREPKDLMGHIAPVQSLAWLGQTNYLVSGGDDGRVIVWAPSHKQPVHRVAQVQAAVSVLKYFEIHSKNSKSIARSFIVAGDSQGGITVFPWQLS